jgi:cell wall-associated NlpC family hydrolase
MTEDEQRKSVISEAKTWLKTPHHNGARLKGVGCDCGTFPWMVYCAAGLMPEMPKELRYSPHFHFSRDEEWYLKLAQKYGKELPPGQFPKPGDFALYKIGRVFSHGVIVIDWPHIIHAYIHVGVTLDHADKGWKAVKKDGKPREVKFFTLW